MPLFTNNIGLLIWCQHFCHLAVRVDWCFGWLGRWTSCVTLFFFFLFHFDYTQHSTLNTMKQLQRGFPKPWTFLITYWRTALTHSPYRLRLQSKTNTVYFSLVSIFSCILQTLVKSSLLGNWDIFRVKVAVEIMWMHVWREYTKGGWKGWRRNWFLRINQKLEKYQHFWDAGMKTGGDDDAQGFCRN